MKSNIQVKDTILQDNEQNLLIAEESSNVIKYHNFGTLSSKLTLWMPQIQKSIFLTSVQVSASQPISILLSDGDDNFLALRITEAFGTIGQHFASPYRLNVNNPLMVNTYDEDIVCNNSGSINATQVDYNGRSDFNNVNNAVGIANGNFSSLNSGLIIQSRGRIVLGYNILPAEYEYLEIQHVVIKYYCRLSLTIAIGVSSMILYWRPNSLENWIELQQINLSIIGSINYLTNPIEQDITEAVLEAQDPWDVINNIQTSFVGVHTGLGLGNIIQLDAVEIEICMTGKNQITLFGYEA